jgi:hypothetical protein
MKKYHDTIRNYLKDEFEKSAIEYLRVGLEIFHRARKGEVGLGGQAPGGNLGIAIELMLKTLIVKHSPILLFIDFPIELQVLFASPESLPKDFNWRLLDIELRSFKYKTKELDECIALLYVLLPEHKQELRSYFQLLARHRNASIHSVLPSFQRYELERLGYLALRLFVILQTTKHISEYSYRVTKDDKAFLAVFKNERIERVKKKVDEAKEKSKHISTIKGSLSIDGWEYYITECPICGNEGILTGYTDIDYEEAPDEYLPNASLDFFADSFECEDCGLKLDDTEELKLVKMDVNYDRSHQLDSWYKDHYDPDPSEYL